MLHCRASQRYSLLPHHHGEHQPPAKAVGVSTDTRALLREARPHQRNAAVINGYCCHTDTHSRSGVLCAGAWRWVPGRHCQPSAASGKAHCRSEIEQCSRPDAYAGSMRMAPAQETPKKSWRPPSARCAARPANSGLANTTAPGRWQPAPVAVAQRRCTKAPAAVHLMCQAWHADTNSTCIKMPRSPAEPARHYCDDNNSALPDVTSSPIRGFWNNLPPDAARSAAQRQPAAPTLPYPHLPVIPKPTPPGAARTF